ncbi:ABC transporter permease [Eubacterium multiforme]|uniref:ABC-2 type transport system permease protein n=1 Tax=Eubacterium multiforme TaxID=83339 RepID=A0ABT9UW89_9FIRM|nr:ABC transporter permease [Eubacterium multiforme]MDQ0150536.1 ABC-2 type transport system permease protein [Eubacterium multiforme]
MNRIKILTKYFLGNSFNNASSGIKSKKLATFLYILILFGLSMPFCNMIMNMYEPFSKIGQEGFLLSFIFLFGSLIILLLGIYDILDSFFFSDDVEPLMPMPFKSSELMIGKFITTLIDMYIYLSIIILPLIAFGALKKAGITYFLMLIPVYLLSPIVTIIFCILIIMLLMSFINISKHQNLFKIIFSTLGIVIMLFLYSLNSNSMSSENVSKAMQSNNGLINLSNKIFITNIFSTKALIYSNSLKGLLNLGLLILISAIALIISCYLGKILYTKTLSKRTDTFSKRENILEKQGNKVIVQNSKIKTLILREIRTILREPSNFINCVVMLIYMPIFVCVFFIKGNIFDGASQEKINIIVMAATFLAISLTISGNAVAATALSREGKDILVSKYIPVSYKTQIHSKIILSFAINGLSILLGIGILIYAKVSPLIFVLSLIIQILTVITISLSEMLLDYTAPKLNWVDIKNLYSKNFRPLLIMLVCLILGIVNIYLGIALSPFIIFLVDGIVLLISIVLLYKFLIKFGIKAYEKDYL